MDEQQRGVVSPGMAYRTRGGWKAYVSDWGKNLVGEECWRGTEEGIGFGTWDGAGKSLSGDERSDLMMDADGNPVSEPASDQALDELAEMVRRA